MITPIPTGEPSFIDAPRCSDLATLEADFAIVGVPNGWPYEMAAVTSPSSPAPQSAFSRLLPWLGPRIGGAGSFTAPHAGRSFS